MNAMQRIEVERDGQTAVLDYTIEPAGTLTIWHVETPFALRGRGIAGELVEQARALAEQRHLTLHPVCPFAKTYLASNPTLRGSSGPRA
ncbi:N-acetyltransferase [Granulicella sp. 5B5]|uniref:GNAT family N-acetyltransferase n=1 Tax=Granulicella sp. 5B5 TaxID=1617967 RepID=UPI0015F4F723|nr:GNAT family N-acetyltransferase [Granulicella sp. 5B5]QMV18211.1 N-acetyltransferase [Granulicella sp. 5B5]